VEVAVAFAVLAVVASSPLLPSFLTIVVAVSVEEEEEEDEAQWSAPFPPYQHYK
jgi:hypothetical protein